MRPTYHAKLSNEFIMSLDTATRLQEVSRMTGIKLRRGAASDPAAVSVAMDLGSGPFNRIGVKGGFDPEQTLAKYAARLEPRD